mmetsp:Transcript_22255/g.57162  ORF Transcript_22255/g.57162 Transcript_22255/m.57162 type:complete len:225 (-) Transcript_22255:563-1237(-)
MHGRTSRLLLRPHCSLRLLPPNCLLSLVRLDTSTWHSSEMGMHPARTRAELTISANLDLALTRRPGRPPGPAIEGQHANSRRPQARVALCSASVLCLADHALRLAPVRISASGEHLPVRRVEGRTHRRVCWPRAEKARVSSVRERRCAWQVRALRCALPLAIEGGAIRDVHEGIHLCLLATRVALRDDCAPSARDGVRMRQEPERWARVVSSAPALRMARRARG